MLQIKRSELKQLAKNKLGNDSLESQNKILVMISTSLAARTSYTIVGEESKKTSEQWQKQFPDIIVLDPDGWNRGERYNFEWFKEKITLEEYKNKVMRSTCEFKVKFEDYFKEEKEVNHENLIALHDRLLAQDPPHCFTEGTEILTDKGWKYFEDLTKEELIASVNIENGKFIGFEKPISFVKNDYEGKIYTYKSKNIDISVTPNHKLLGISVSKALDRSRDYDTLEIIEPQQKISDSKTLGEREMIMFSAPKEPVIKDLKMYKEGQLLGFFLGDGSARYKNSIRFRLKKERKKSYIINVLKGLGIDYTINFDSKNIYNIKANIGDYTVYYDEDYNKRIPENILFNIINHVDFIAGLFDGLKNSDGSIKRNTWVYDTFSTPLRDNILFLCPLIGLTGRENPSYNHHRISFLTNNKILVNDSRKPESKVLIEDYTGKVYCVETPSHGIIVRKNGKVLITHNSSPFEHTARAMNEDEYYSFVKGVSKNIDNTLVYDFKDSSYGWCYNLKGFIPYRYFVDNRIDINF